MRSILLAAHGGASADGAARVAALLAERVQTHLDVIVVVEPPRVAGLGVGPIVAPDPEGDRLLREDLLQSVRRQLARCGLASCEPEVVTGSPAPAIAEAAAARGASLIVVGLGPHHLTDRALGGETALQLVQLAATPVLAMPEQVTALPARAVAAMDFTRSSFLAAQTAAALLGRGDALHLVQ